jgi:hypothetical protein
LTAIHNVSLALFKLDRHEECLPFLEQVVYRPTELQGDAQERLNSTCMLAKTLSALDRDEESLPLCEVVVERYTIVKGESHEYTLVVMDDLAWKQFYLGHIDEAQRTASRGLLLARNAGNDKRAAGFDGILSTIREHFEDEQKRVREKMSIRKQETAGKVTAMAEAARVEIPEPPMSDADINKLMEEFDAMDGGGKKKASSNEGGGGGGGSKKKKGKGKKGGK